MRYALLDPILEVMAREGRIKQSWAGYLKK